MARNTPRILVAGSANMDLMARVDKIPSGGETALGEDYEYLPGGKGANAALAVSRMGGDCVFCTRLGKDTNGNRLTSFYNRHGIDTRFISVDYNLKTGLAVVIVEGDGENRIIVYPGANMALTPDDVEEALTSYPDALYMQFEIPEETIIAGTRLANAQGIPVIIDAGPAISDFPLEELGTLEVFSPNESETLAYTGIRPVGDESCFKACKALSARVKAKYYVLKLGARGAFIYDGIYCTYVQPYDVKAVDTTAAGDSFTAAMTCELLRSRDIKRAVEYGNLAGALTVMRAGASSSIPTNEEIRNFVYDNDIKFRI